ncbi:GntR family transcriptional regulator [Fictibacillus sp. KIGAM418]|uniref:GntR family transcriptional regulator n=1 Tax=Fictibacillus marinisediminis TaxID=2878389 RepID=A0A9X1XB66_9BACL|nr:MULTISPECIES: GntR family transcriptional regulator [Fictibacillus]MCK6257358.1 GntR family transcriptional regulator [Fictibacillus marinisediminis]MED2974885.1 GntR family transcriptional regulator [Fictibacillus sp. B-59209]
MREIQKTELLHSQVYTILKAMIMESEFQPGERLVETKVALQLGVSRGTVREAFQMLLKDGLLTRDNNVIFVYNPSVQDIVDVYECRKSLESLAVKLATTHIQDEQLNQLGFVLEESKKAVKRNDTQTLTNLNQEFHDIIDLASHNKQLIQLCEVIKTKTLYIRNNVLKNHFKNFSDFVDDHERIYLAIKERKASKAEQEMITHIEKSFETIQNALNSDPI